MYFINKISRLLFPEKCPLCGNIIPIEKSSCPDCDTKRTYISSDFCEGCGYDKERCICGSGKIQLSHIAAVSLYDGITKAEIYQFKFKEKKQYGKSLAHKMSLRISEAFPKAEFDCVTFVPMTEQSKKERSFNQSEYLARHVAKNLFLNSDTLLYKNKETKKQHTITAAERICNLIDAFSLCEGKSVKGKTVLLCDDIKTTGSTLRECEKVLLKGGAKDVYCICIALTDYGDIFPTLDKTD